MKLGEWLIYHNIMMQNQMLLLNHNDVPVTIFEFAIAIVIAVALAVFFILLLEKKIKESILTIIIGLSLSVWLFSLNNVPSSTNC
ncbi:hypothetical protein ACRPOS_006085 [Bartonella heixiaziensis]|uniref:hypothetical protein n=1 Tax=Bartonella heixiaziensis TaxID=1461000 RepID=UPI003908AE32